MTTPTLPSRDDPGTTPTPTAGRCPVCASTFTPAGRQTYCTTACRKTAFRRRHHTATPAPLVPAGTSRRDVSAYQCDSCGERQLGQQRCDDCNTFGTSLGLAGTCPHCDGIIAAADLDQNT